MKTTIELPDSLFRDVEAYAATTGESFEKLIENSLRRNLEQSNSSDNKDSFRNRRELNPKFTQIWRDKGTLVGFDSTESISEERESA